MKLKIYYGARESMEVELPNDITAINIGNESIIYRDTLGAKTEYNIVMGNDSDVGVELQRTVEVGIPHVKKDTAKMERCGHIKIMVKKV